MSILIDKDTRILVQGITGREGGFHAVQCQKYSQVFAVGGGANQEMVENAFRILMSDDGVKAVFINIFGGILRCDVLAEGVVAAVKNVNVNVPIVIRMEGTNVEKGREILEKSGLDFTVGDGMADAAEKVVAALGR